MTVSSSSVSEPISDYAGYDYKQDFWGGGKREYEDLCERRLLAKLIQKAIAHDRSGHGGIFSQTSTPQCAALMDAGCGFGRLFPVVEPYGKEIICFDYAQHLLDQAREQIGDRSGVRFVQGDLYDTGLPSGSLSLVTSVRTLHHLTPHRFFTEMHRLLCVNGYFIFEIPNKRHLLNIARYMIHPRPHHSPFSKDVLDLGETFKNYHPKVVLNTVRDTGFSVIATYNTSYFRSAFLKKYIDASLLCKLDALAQSLSSGIYMTPSLFCLCQKR